jgi:hypothetical protein
MVNSISNSAQRALRNTQSHEERPAAPAVLDRLAAKSLGATEIVGALALLSSPLRNDGSTERMSGIGAPGAHAAEAFGSQPYRPFTLRFPEGTPLTYDNLAKAMAKEPWVFREIGVELSPGDFVDCGIHPAKAFFSNAWAIEGRASDHVQRVLDVVSRSLTDVRCLGDVSMGMLGHKLLVGKKDDRVYGLFVHEYGT